ncbi:MAG TPA: DUF1634 domain-containing protein [Candidatus Binataceae bacterium]|jgi:uncharacterized membrane protein
MATQATATADEDRILRRWTPLILRAILIVSTVIMVAGIALSITFAPDYYVGRFDAIQRGRLLGHESVWQLVQGMRQGQPHAVMIIGLYVLTLVPLARVAFTLVLFLKERDFIYVAATAYVLAALIMGVMLGRVG